MKKFLIGFMFLTMIILPNYNVNAAISGNDGINYPDKPDDGNDGYIIGYFWKYNQWNQAVYTTRLITFNTEETKYISTGYWSNGVYLNLYKKPVCSDGQSNYTDVCTTSITEDNYSNSISYTYDSSNNSWVLENESGARQYFRATKIYYSTMDIYYRQDAAKSTYPESSYFIPGEHDVPTKHPDTGLTLKGLDSSYYDMTYEHNSNVPKIISKLFLGTLLDAYLVTFDFEHYYDQDYKYRYKTDEIGFVDITDKVHSSENHTYPFTLAYNTEITVQVLDSEDNVVYEETDTTTEALDISTFSLKQAYSSASIGGLEQVTFELDWDDYGFAKLNQGVPLKLELDYGSNDLDPAKTPNLLSYRVLAYSETNSLLDINLLDYFDFYGGTTKKYYEEDYEKFSRFVFTTLKGLPEEVAKIKIIFNFDNLDNYYIYAYEYYDSGGVWDKVTTDTKGYTKYTFPEGYSRAIIRSKSFTNLQSSIITDFFYLNSGNFKLHSYDFTNRKVVKKDYKFSEYYLNEYLVKLPVDIDETNNVFPIIVKQTQCGVSGYYLHTDLSYKGFLKWFYITDSYDDYFTPIYSHCSDNPYFYLKDDLFVQFIHDDDLPNVIGGIDKDTFDENNDVIIWDSFIDDTDQFTKDDNLVISDSVSGKVEEFFKDTGEYIKQIIAIPFYFLSRLNPWIERSIIIMFWCLIITRVVKVMRK